MSKCQDVFCKNRTSYGYCKFTACTKHQETIILDDNESDWIEIDGGLKYKTIRNNGHWEIIKWEHDTTYYSFCPFCGYVHVCCKDNRNEDGTWSLPIYAPENEFNYCPMCGKDMEVNRQ